MNSTHELLLREGRDWFMFFRSSIALPLLFSTFAIGQKTQDPMCDGYLPVLRRFTKSEAWCGTKRTIRDKSQKEYEYFPLRESGRYLGYVLCDGTGEFLQAYLSDKPSTREILPTIFPFADEVETLQPKAAKNKSAAEIFFPWHYPEVQNPNSSYSWTDTSDYSQYFWLEGVPEYYWSSGCTPTAAAMFVSYLDRYCPDFQTLIDGFLPLKTPLPILDEDNVNGNAVEWVIDELADCMGTKDGQTLDIGICGGIENYFARHGVEDYYMKSSTDYSLLTCIVREARLPVVVDIKTDVYGDVDHTVLVYGYVYRPYQVLPDLICHSTWTSAPGNYFFSPNHFFDYRYVTNVSH